MQIVSIPTDFIRVLVLSQNSGRTHTHTHS